MSLDLKERPWLLVLLCSSSDIEGGQLQPEAGGYLLVLKDPPAQGEDQVGPIRDPRMSHI